MPRRHGTDLFFAAGEDLCFQGGFDVSAYLCGKRVLGPTPYREVPEPRLDLSHQPKVRSGEGEGAQIGVEDRAVNDRPTDAVVEQDAEGQYDGNEEPRAEAVHCPGRKGVRREARRGYGEGRAQGREGRKLVPRWGLP